MRRRGPRDARGGRVFKRGDRCGIFEITGLLGKGGMGEVYKARDPVAERVVAIKVVHVGNPGDGLPESAKKEARTLSRLEHPNIVRFYLADRTQDGVLYIVMEHVEGITLRELLHRAGALDLPSALSMAAQITDAIWVAHDLGIIHRDLKPENVLVTEKGKIKVVDFGVARWVGGHESSDLFANAGTVHYMAPEQVRGRGVVKATDIYAIGMILHEMLSGRYAFAEATGEMPTRAEAEQQHLHAVPRPLEEAVPGFDAPAVSALVSRMLAKTPSERPSAEAVMEVLRTEYQRWRARHPGGQGRFDLKESARPPAPLHTPQPRGAGRVVTTRLPTNYRPSGNPLPFKAPEPAAEEAAEAAVPHLETAPQAATRPRRTAAMRGPTPRRMRRPLHRRRRPKAQRRSRAPRAARRRRLRSNTRAAAEAHRGSVGRRRRVQRSSSAHRR